MFTKKWTSHRFLFFVLLLSLSACTFRMEVLIPTPPVATTPPGDTGLIPSQPVANSEMLLLALPDLVVSSMFVSMVDANGRCLNGYMIQAVIFNQGTAPADGVVAVESATGHQVVIGRLEAGQSMDIQIPAAPANGSYLISVDPHNVIAESNETNNNLSYLLPTPTPFVGCISTPSASATPAPYPVSSSMPSQLLAYMRDGKLMITEITNDTPGRTKEYELAGIDNSYPVVPIWSPSGAHLVLSAQVNQELHTFYLWDLESGVPVDMGPGSHPAWSPDGQSIAYIGGQYPDNNLWSTTLPNLSPRPLTSEKNFVWGSMAFTPDGQALVAVGQSHDLAGATGNFPSYAPEYIALDGSGARSRFLSDVIPDLGGSHLPENLQFSSNGKWLAFSTFSHMSASCASGKYYAITADGSTVQELRSSSLENVVGENSALVILPGNYAWSPASESLAISSGGVIDCDTGERIASQQLSIIGLDGNERLVLPGQFGSPSYDCSGAFLAVTHSQNLQDMNPTIEIYSVQTGQMVLSLGLGMSPSFQPSPSCVILR
jgi:hypothetical protein